MLLFMYIKCVWSFFESDTVYKLTFCCYPIGFSSYLLSSHNVQTFKWLSLFFCYFFHEMSDSHLLPDYSFPHLLHRLLFCLFIRDDSMSDFNKFYHFAPIIDLNVYDFSKVLTHPYISIC